MKNWFLRNQNKISLFIAGWCALAAIDCFARGDWFWMAVNAFLVFVNIKLADD
jgi:hypothetical protein